MSTTFNLQQRVAQTPGHLVSNMNGEKVMMSIEKGKYYNLGHVGGRIWELIESPSTIEEITSALLSEYDVDRNTCENQVQSFLNHLLSEGLIQVEGTHS